MNEAVRSEITALWEKVASMDKKISDFIDAVHKTSTDGIKENSDGIIDVADVSGQMYESIEDLENRVSALEGK